VSRFTASTIGAGRFNLLVYCINNPVAKGRFTIEPRNKRKVKHIIHGEVASKANSRRLVTFGGKPRFIKSKKALQFEKDLQMQVPRLNNMLEGDLAFHAAVYYPSRRQDLDPSVILDALQGLVYANDRQVKVISCARFLDKISPRAEIIVSEIDFDEDGGDVESLTPPIALQGDL